MTRSHGGAARSGALELPDNDVVEEKPIGGDYHSIGTTAFLSMTRWYQWALSLRIRVWVG